MCLIFVFLRIRDKYIYKVIIIQISQEKILVQFSGLYGDFLNWQTAYMLCTDPEVCIEKHFALGLECTNQGRKHKTGVK